MSDAPTVAPPRPDIDIELAPDSDTELDPPYDVILHNDDLTPMNFVVEVLRTVFELSRPRATRVMLEAHHNGKALVVTLGREEAKFRVGQAHSLARSAGYPLSFTIEPA